MSRIIPPETTASSDRFIRLSERIYIVLDCMFSISIENDDGTIITKSLVVYTTAMTTDSTYITPTKRLLSDQLDIDPILGPNYWTFIYQILPHTIADFANIRGVQVADDGQRWHAIRSHNNNNQENL